MKLVNFFGSEGVQAGLVHDGGVEDLAASNLWRGPAPVALSDISSLAAKFQAPASPLAPIESLRLAPVVVAPEKIICVGLNYRRHAIEANMPIPTTPVIFGKFVNSLSASGDRIVLPTVDFKYDYEAELGVVIGREVRDVSVDQALDSVAGYCCANDLSARGAQLATSQWMIGKMLDGFLPLGPFLVTTDDIPDPQVLRIQCRVNGEVRQLSSTSDMIFSVAEIVAFLSRYATLKPGDVIITGTPEGVLMGHKTPIWLKPGDEVAIDIAGLGVLTNDAHHGGNSFMKTILVTDHVFPNLDPENAVLKGIGTLREAASVKDAELLELARDADAVLNCYRPLSGDIVEAMKKCRIIARYGIGVDTIPLEVATSRGIQVTNVPDYCIEEVADHGLALILALTRGIIRGLDQIRGGGWNVKSLRPLHRQRGRTLGLVGFGRIARALAHRATALGYEIIVSDPFLSDEAVRTGGARAVDLDTLFKESDVVSLHAPLTSKTRHMVNAERLATMRPGAVLVNTSRGGLVDYEAVVTALRGGTLGGAGLDVLETEPPAAGSTPISEVPNLVVTPHLAFYSEQALVDLQRKAAEQIRAVLEGRAPDYPVNTI